MNPACGRPLRGGARRRSNLDPWRLGGKQAMNCGARRTGSGRGNLGRPGETGREDRQRTRSGPQQGWEACRGGVRGSQGSSEGGGTGARGNRTRLRAHSGPEPKPVRIARTSRGSVCRTDRPNRTFGEVTGGTQTVSRPLHPIRSTWVPIGAEVRDRAFSEPTGGSERAHMSGQIQTVSLLFCLIWFILVPFGTETRHV